MILQLRTKDNLEDLLRHGNSPAWNIANGREEKINAVEIFSFDGKQVLKAVFDIDKSSRNEKGRLIVAFKNAVIEDADFKWVGQNPVKYKAETNELIDKDLLEEMNNALASITAVLKMEEGNVFVTEETIQAALDDTCTDAISTYSFLINNDAIREELKDVFTPFKEKLVGQWTPIVVFKHAGDWDYTPLLSYKFDSDETQAEACLELLNLDQSELENLEGHVSDFFSNNMYGADVVFGEEIPYDGYAVEE